MTETFYSRIGKHAKYGHGPVDRCRATSRTGVAALSVPRQQLLVFVEIISILIWDVRYSAVCALGNIAEKAATFALIACHST